MRGWWLNVEVRGGRPSFIPSRLTAEGLQASLSTTKVSGLQNSRAIKNNTDTAEKALNGYGSRRVIRGR